MSEIATRPTFTEKQERAWREDVAPVLARHGINSDPPERSVNWMLTWSEETRLGRGHFLTAQFLDGEHFAQVQMDVYGYPTVSVAALDWIHNSADEEFLCETCGETEGDDE